MRTIKTTLAALLNTGIRGTLAALLLTASAALLTTSCANNLGDDIPTGGTQADKSLTFTLPTTLDGFNESGAQTRAVAGFDKGDHKWQTGDKILALIFVGDGTKGVYNRYYIYTTLTCSAAATTTGGTATWTVNAGTDVLIQHVTTSSSVKTNSGDNALLTTAAGAVTLTLPAALATVANIGMQINLYYAPAQQWTANDGNTAVNLTRTAESPCQATTQYWTAEKYKSTIFAPADFSTVLAELTDFSKTETTGYTYTKFAPKSSRLRVYMGADKAGEIVTLVAGNTFTGAAERRLSTSGTGPTDKYPTNYTYTATVDATGNAYFYGYTDYAMDGTDDAGFDKRFTVTVFDTEVFAASTTNTVNLGTEGKSYAIDASWVAEPIVTYDQFAAAMINNGTTDEDIALRNKLNASNDWRIDMAGYSEAKDATNVTNVKTKIDAHTAGAVNLKLTNLKKIAKNAFTSCTKLTTIDLPAVETIGASAFNGCTALTTLNLPAAKTISGSAFYQCSALATLNLPAAETIGVQAFNGCYAITTLNLPEAMSIGGNAFDGCSKLTTLNLPAATSIGAYAFANCSALTTLKLTAAGNIRLYSYAFYDFSNAGNRDLYLNPDKESGGTPAASGKSWGGQTWKSISYE